MSYRKIVREILVYITNHLISRIIFSSIRMFWYQKVMGFQIGKLSSILTDFKIAGQGNLKIGKHTIINNGCRFDNRFQIIIGDNVSITYGTMILTKGHDIDSPSFKTRGGKVTIEDYVWVCANAIILPEVKIGKGSVVLPGSVVTKDVEPFHVVGGNPAKFIKKRSKNLKYQLNWNPKVPFFG